MMASLCRIRTVKYDFDASTQSILSRLKDSDYQVMYR